MTAAYFEDHPTDPEKVILRKPPLDQGADYERGFVDGMQKQMQSTVDKAVNHMAQPEQEPVAHSVIAGALFDFMGWLTSRKERIVLSSANNASPAVDAIRDFANMRGLSLDDAKVQDWNTTPPQRTWVGLTQNEVKSCWLGYKARGYPPERVMMFYKLAEQMLKEKNT